MLVILSCLCLYMYTLGVYIHLNVCGYGNDGTILGCYFLGTVNPFRLVRQGLSLVWNCPVG